MTQEPDSLDLQVADIVRHGVRAFYARIMDNRHHRYRSWEHCYAYFRAFHQMSAEARRAHRDTAALHLAFYLASWGMFRGSSFLLQNAYTIHGDVVDHICEPEFSLLWQEDFGVSSRDTQMVPIISRLVSAVRLAYEPYGHATDTLVTKVVLGTVGCLPACDRYFLDGLKSVSIPFSGLKPRFIQRLSAFANDNQLAIKEEQAAIERAAGIRYPAMKLIDMCLWQRGYEQDTRGAVELEIHR